MEPNRVSVRVPDVQPSLVSPVVTIEDSFTEVVKIDFAAWYNETRPTVVRALTLTLGDGDLAREAADEALTRAYQSWSKVQSLDNPGGWVYRVALNWALSSFRRRRPSKRAFHVIPADMPVPSDGAVQRALNALDVDQRAVVVCRYLLGWSEQETADILQIRPGTVKSRLSRASSQLRGQLGHLRPESSS
jgi:DNA-directed RNA polymerase specialized sigma24 family protein